MFQIENGVMQHTLPTDPMQPLQAILAYATGTNKDYKVLIHAIYDLVGWGVHLIVDQATPEAKANEAMSEIQKCMTNPQLNQALPPFVIPLILQILTLVLQRLQQPQVPQQ